MITKGVMAVLFAGTAGAGGGGRTGQEPVA